MITPAITAAPNFTKSRVRRLEASVALGAIFFVLVFAGLAFAASGPAAIAALKSVNPAIIPAMLALSATNYLLRMLRWTLFTQTLGLHVPPLRNALYYVAGFAMTTTPGKLGEAVRLWLLNRGHGLRYRDTTALLFADRLSDAQSMALVAALSVGWLSAYLSVSISAFAVVAGVTLVSFYPSLLVWGVGLAYRITGRAPRFFVTLRHMIRPLRNFAHPRVLALSLALGVCGWFAEGVSLHLLLQTLNVTLPLMTAIFIFAFGMIVGALSFLPGGLGSTEATMIGLLHVSGVPTGQAIVATAIVRVTTLWFAVALGAIALPVAIRVSAKGLAS